MQLTELGVKLRPLNADYLEHWADRWGIGRAATVSCALEVLYILAALPKLARLAPLPGEARSGSLAPGRAHLGPAGQRMLEWVRALLAKAESTEFEAEAEALTARAQELMARHSSTTHSWPPRPAAPSSPRAGACCLRAPTRGRRRYCSA